MRLPPHVSNTITFRLDLNRIRFVPLTALEHDDSENRANLRGLKMRSKENHSNLDFPANSFVLQLVPFVPSKKLLRKTANLLTTWKPMEPPSSSSGNILPHFMIHN